MRKLGATVLTAVALATTTAWAQTVNQPDAPKPGTVVPPGVVVAPTPDGGVALKSDARPANATVPAITGGVSVNARETLRQAEKDANVKMVFALNTGNYVSDVRVKVVDGKGNVVIDDVADGPWLLAKLPPGTYTATAIYNGKPVTQKFTVGKSGVKTAYFRWPASVEQAVGATDTDAGGEILGTGPQEPKR
jgi:hypothetical protein